MANLVPYQFNKNGKLVRDIDTKISGRKGKDDFIVSILGDRVESFVYKKGQKAGTYKFYGENGDVYFILLNITYMGGDLDKNGKPKNPLDLKRLQIDDWVETFYNKYKNKGKVKLLGVYLYDKVDVFTEFVLDTYILRKMNNSATHVYLNDLYQGYEHGYFEKLDKNNNKIITINKSKLADYLDEKVSSTILKTFNDINDKSISWNKWILASEAIPFIRDVAILTNNKYCEWKQNLWNGWFLEAIYLKYILEHPLCGLSFIEISKFKNSTAKRISNNYKLDLGINYYKDNYEYLADLKNDSFDTNENIYFELNDCAHVEGALKEYKKIWFVIYMHNKKPGSTNDFEMVKWRNEYITSIDGEKRNIMSAPRTPHSIMFRKMAIIEMNSITKDKYFVKKEQRGRNSDGRIRKMKYYIKMSDIERLMEDDSIVIYRYIPS